MSGVRTVIVGYAGGSENNPTYEDIKDYTEAVRVYYDPEVISFEEILESFFEQQDGSYYYPCGSRQYRSVIWTHSDRQQNIANGIIRQLSSSNRKVHTAVEIATSFYRAEEYHQKYYDKSKENCVVS